MLSKRTRERRHMVDTQIRRRGLTDERVLAALERVPRHRFVPESEADLAYADRPLDIGEGQTISQPFMVAKMAESARIGAADRVLEVGTGSGYGAAVLAELAEEVITVERIDELAAKARARLAALGYDNARVELANGALGCPRLAPFDAIVVTAGASRIPRSLIEQLAPEGGRLVIPVGERPLQVLLRLTRNGDTTEVERLGAVRFVPLVGAEAHFA